MHNSDTTGSDQKLWFKAKRYGWGWYPASKEGWFVLLIYVLLFAAAEIIFVRRVVPSHSSSGLICYAIFVVSITALLIWISWKKGEKPHWRWGGKD